MGAICFTLEPHLQASEFIDVLIRSTLADRRPVNDGRTIAAMLANADVIATARTAPGQLVGVARAINDFSYCTYRWVILAAFGRKSGCSEQA